jgi:hypothetical protein
MLENNSSNKVIATFDGNENIGMTDSLNKRLRSFFREY